MAFDAAARQGGTSRRHDEAAGSDYREFMRIRLTHGDITTITADAIVNAAKSTLLGGGGVDGAIHRAGGPSILAECRELRAGRLVDGLPTGEAVATGAGNLPAHHVIHTVGPVHGRGEADLLDRCYASCLRVATEIRAATITFPLISAGAYGWPKDDALRRALTTLHSTSSGVEDATLVLFSAADLELARQIAAETGIDTITD